MMTATAPAFTSAERRIAIVDDDLDLADSVAEYLSLHDYAVETANDANGARQLVDSFSPGVALVDLRLGTENGLDLLSSLRAIRPDIVCILVTAYADIDAAVEALRRGAYDFLQKPFRFEELLAAIDRSFDRIAMREEVQAAELARDTAEIQFQTVVDNLPVGVSFKDRDGTITFANKTMASWFDKQPEDIIGKSMDSLLPEITVNQINDHERAVLDSEDVSAGIIRYFPHVDRTLLIHKCTIRGADGMVQGICTISSDITERQKAEAMLIQSEQLVTLGHMAAGISHELSQPLNIIRLATHSALFELHDGRLNDELNEETLNEIDQQVSRMATIIDHMTIVARDESRIDQAFDARAAVKTAVIQMRESLRAEGISLDLELLDDKAAAVGSSIMLEQVIQNLVTNARDAVAERFGQRIDGDSEDCPQITVKMETADHSHIISITDNGGGIPDDCIKRLFDPFFTTKSPGTGMGLGLWVCINVVHSMGGKLDAENTNGGARFTITLPNAVD